MSARPRAVVFDFGGVLFRWEPRRLLRELWPARVPDAAAAEHWFEQVFQHFAPGSDWAGFDLGTLDREGIAARIAARIHVPLAEVLALVDAIAPHLQPQAPMVAMLQRLHAAGVPLYYLSNMPSALAEGLEARHDFLRLFRDGVFSSRVGQIKPEAAIYRTAQQRFGHAPGELLFIDDHVLNVETARALGWQALLFVDAARCEAEVDALLGLPTPCIA